MAQQPLFIIAQLKRIASYTISLIRNTIIEFSLADICQKVLTSSPTLKSNSEMLLKEDLFSKLQVNILHKIGQERFKSSPKINSDSDLLRKSVTCISILSEIN